MRTKFTKASRKDKTLVTVSLAQLENEENFTLFRSEVFINSRLIIDIDGHEVVFYVNRVRDGLATTAVTHCFPRFMRLPQVGRPVYQEVRFVSSQDF